MHKILQDVVSGPQLSASNAAAMLWGVSACTAKAAELLEPLAEQLSAQLHALPPVQVAQCCSVLSLERVQCGALSPPQHVALASWMCTMLEDMYLCSNLGRTRGHHVSNQ